MLNALTSRLLPTATPHDKNASEDTLLAVVLSLLPLFHLSIKSWTNVSLGLLFVLALVAMFKKPFFLRQLLSSWETTLIFVALVAPLLGIVTAQLLRHQWFFKAQDGPFRMALAAFVFLLLKEKKTRFLVAFRWVCPLSVIVCFISILLFRSGTEHSGGRFTTYFADCDVFGQHIVLLAFLGFMMFQMDAIGSKSLLAVDLLSLAAGSYMALGSQTRGAWIALCPLGLMWMFFLKQRPLKVISTAVVAAIFFSVLLYLNPAFNERLVSIYRELHGWWSGQNIDTSGGVRLSMWKITFALFKHSPLYGYGEFEQFKSVLQEPFITSISSVAAGETIKNGPHNQLAAEVLRSGVFGLLYSLGSFVIPGLVFWRRFHSGVPSAQPSAVIGLCVVVAFAVFSLTLEVFNLKFAVSFYGFLIAALGAECLSCSVR
jgi:O-antigen ligase